MYAHMQVHPHAHNVGLCWEKNKGRKKKTKTKNSSNIFTVNQHWHEFWQYFPPRLNTRNGDERRRCVTISLWLHDKPRCQGGLCLVNIQQGCFKRHIVCQASTLGRAFSLESLSFISDFPGSGIGGYIITFIQVKLRKGCLSFFSSRLPDSPPWILKTFSWLIYMLTSRLPGELLFLDQKILIKKESQWQPPPTPTPLFSPWGLKGNSVNHWSLTSHLCDGSEHMCGTSDKWRRSCRNMSRMKEAECHLTALM